VATKEAPPADVAAPGERESTGAPVTGDIRRRRPYLLASSPLRNLLFRAASVVALVAIDLVAVGFALYAALALREVYYGHSPILWGVLWTAEGNASLLADPDLAPYLTEEEKAFLLTPGPPSFITPLRASASR